MKKRIAARLSVIVSLTLILCILSLSLNIPLSAERAQASPQEKPEETYEEFGDTIDAGTITEDLFPDAPLLSPEELTEVRDANTKTYLNPDGSYSRDIYMAPIHWQDANGDWQEIDSDLVEEKTRDGYDLANASNAWRARIARDTGSGKQFLLEVEDKKMALNLTGYGSAGYKAERDDGAAAAESEAPSLEQAPASECEAEKNKASWKVTDLFSLEYIVTDVVVEQLIVLESPEAPNAFSFSLDLSGLDVKQDDLGYLRFFDQADGHEVFSITPPVMKDSNIDAGSGDPAFSCDVSLVLTQDEKGRSTITMTADPAWLADPARVYPVYIDPTLVDIFPIYPGQSQFLHGDAYASSAYPNNNYGCDWTPYPGGPVDGGFFQLKSGYYNSGTGHNSSAVCFDVRSFFHNSPDDPDGSLYNLGANITSSTFYAYCFHAYYPSTPTQLWLSYATTDWAEDTLTWNSFPETYPIGEGSVCQGDWFTCDATAATQMWVAGEENGGWRNRGFVIDENGSADPGLWKKFASWENGTEFAPRLRVNYTLVGVTTNTDEVPVKMRNGDTRSANLFVRNTGEETWQCKGTNPTNPVQVEAYLTDRAGGNRQASSIVDLPRDVQPGQTISVSVPVTAPASGTDWRINFDMRKKDVYTFSSRGCNPARVDLTCENAYPSDSEREASARLGKLSWMSYAPFSMGKVSGTMSANLATGNATCSYTDLAVSGRGVPFSITRTYNSLAPTRTTLFGQNWFSNLDAKVVEYTSGGNPTGYLAFYDAQGTSYLLVQGKKDNTFVSPEGAYFKAERNPAFTNPDDLDYAKNWKYKVTGTSGTMLHFDGDGRFRYAVEPSISENGGYKNITRVTYSGTPPMPTSVTDASGRTFSIATSGGRITSVSEDASWASATGHTPRTVSYDYDAEGRLVQATLSPGNHFLQYAYSVGNITQVTENVDDVASDTSTCYLAYDAAGRLASFRDARSADPADVTYRTAVLYNSGFTQLESPSITSNVPGYTAHGVKVRYYLDAAGHCTTRYTGEGWLERVNYTWNACHQNVMVTNYGTSTTTPLGSTYFTYDGKGNVSRVEDDLNDSEKAVSTADHAASSNNSENPTQVTTPDGDTVKLEYNAGESYFKTVDRAGAQSISAKDPFTEVEREGLTIPSTYVNLFQNPSFERGSGPAADGWSTGGEVNGRSYSIQTVSDGSLPAGRRFQRLTVSGNTNTGSTYIWQQAAVSASTDYTLAFSYRNNACDNQQNAIIIRQYNSSMTKIGSDAVITPYRYTGWSHIGTTLKTYETTAYVRVYLRTIINATNQSAQTDFDGAHLYRGTRDTSFNYLENAAFEGDLGSGNWTASGGNVTRTTDKRMSPDNSLKIENAGSATQNVNVKPSTKYLLTGYIWVDGTGYSSGGGISYCLSGGSTGYLASGSGHGYYGYGSNLATNTGKWLRLYGVLESGPSASTLQVTLSVTTNAGASATAYFDDIQLTELPDNTIKEYDTRSNYVTSATDPLGNTGWLAYDPVGNVVQARDARSASSSDDAYLFSYSYNELNQLASVTTPEIHDPNGVSKGSYDSEYAYDTAGRMASFSDNRDKVTGFSHNELDKVASKTDPQDNETQVDYNEAGGIRSITYPSGWEAYFSYDLAGRPEKMAFYNPATQLITTAYWFSHDSAGNLTGVNDAAGNPRATYTYDKASRVTSATDYHAGGFTGSFTYTKEGKAKRTTYSKSGWGTGAFVEYSYRDSGELAALNINNQRSFSYVYDDRGRLSTCYIPDASSSGNYSSTALTYDAVGRPLTISNSSQGFGMAHSYSYDEIGNITSTTTRENNQTILTDQYVYDEMSRLKIWIRNGSYTKYYYDGAGNITNVSGSSPESYAYDDANRILTRNGTAFAYDDNGNLTSDGTWTYTYDRGARLVRAESVTADTIIDFDYDARGNRLKKKVINRASGTLRYALYYHYDARGNILCETNGSGSVVRSYAYDPAGHPVAFTQNVSGVGLRTYYLHTNAHGDVTYVTRDDGIWVKKFTYDPWGKLTNEESRNDSYGNYTTLVCPYTYAGYFYDSETGLYCMPARYYSPTLRRFLTKDPHPGSKANPLTLNPYQYCKDNPVMRVDPSGQHDLVSWLRETAERIIAIYNQYKGQWRHIFSSENRCATGTVGTPGTRPKGPMIFIASRLLVPTWTERHSGTIIGLGWAIAASIGTVCTPILVQMLAGLGAGAAASELFSNMPDGSIFAEIYFIGIASPRQNMYAVHRVETQENGMVKETWSTWDSSQDPWEISDKTLNMMFDGGLRGH